MQTPPIDALVTRARATPEVPLAVRSSYELLSGQLSPAAKIWFSEQTARLKGQNWAVDAPALRDSIRARFPAAAQDQCDALLLMFAVLAASNHRANLRLLADQLEREMNRHAELKLAAVVPRSATRRPPLSVITMEKQKRLQFYLDAYNRAAALISTLTSTSSDAGQSIVGNLQ
jgi:hypothetical protein